MENLKELYKGFLWGCGFAIATAIIYFILISRFAASAEQKYRADIRDMTATEYNNAAQLVSPEVIAHKVEKGFVILGIKYNNLIDAGFLGASFDLKISMFSDKNKLIGTCSQPLKAVHSSSDVIHTQFECRSVFETADSYSYAKVEVVVLPRA